jgi:hypothetical protein
MRQACSAIDTRALFAPAGRSGHDMTAQAKRAALQFCVARGQVAALRMVWLPDIGKKFLV